MKHSVIAIVAIAMAFCSHAAQADRTAAAAKRCMSLWLASSDLDGQFEAQTLEYLPANSGHLGMGFFLAESMQTSLGKKHILVLGGHDSAQLADALLYAADSLRKAGEMGIRALEKVSVYHIGLAEPQPRLQAAADSAGMGFTSIVLGVETWGEALESGCRQNKDAQRTGQQAGE